VETPTQFLAIGLELLIPGAESGRSVLTQSR